MSSPQIALVKRSDSLLSLERFEVRGEVESQPWADNLRPPEAPWCEIGIWGGCEVSSFGGSVWPSAWPSLFQFDGPEGRRRIILTEAGLAAFEAARKAGAK